MELAAVHVALLHRRHHRDTVVGLGDNGGRVSGHATEGVDKVDVATLLHPSKQRRRVGVAQAVPADVGQLKIGLNLTDTARYKSKSFTLPHLFTPVEEQLHSQANAQDGFAFCLGHQHLVQTGPPQLIRRVGEGSHTRQDDGVGQLQLFWIAGDTGFQAQVVHGVGHALQIAHAVVHDSGITHHSTPLVEVTPVPVICTASLTATPRDLNRASVMWWAFFP